MCSRLKRQFVWREGAGNDFVVGYTGHWGSFLELSKTIDFVAAIGTVLLGVVGEVCNYSIIRERCNSHLFQPSEGYCDEWL